MTLLGANPAWYAHSYGVMASVGSFLCTHIPASYQVVGSPTLGVPISITHVDRLSVMREPLTVAAFDAYRCATHQLDLDHPSPSSSPVTGVPRAVLDHYISWQSERDGIPWRLPTLEEMEVMRRGPASRIWSADDTVRTYVHGRSEVMRGRAARSDDGTPAIVAVRVERSADVLITPAHVWDVWENFFERPRLRAVEASPVRLLQGPRDIAAALKRGAEVMAYGRYPTCDGRIPLYLAAYDTAETWAADPHSNPWGIRGLSFALGELAVGDDGALYIFGGSLPERNPISYLAAYRRRCESDIDLQRAAIRLVANVPS